MLIVVLDEINLMFGKLWSNVRDASALEGDVHLKAFILRGNKGNACVVINCHLLRGFPVNFAGCVANAIFHVSVRNCLAIEYRYVGIY